ncbi:hypothetical protein MFIFM68171_04449 [Madurella fahalii]|uniref:Uncharacterized protein n=1 Tax=Madurella fahalii TaxID=1157608 RepID=A0ABQ0G935_9PEZI
MHAFRSFKPMKLRSGEISDYQSVDRSSAGTSADEAAKLPVCNEEPLDGSDTDPHDDIADDDDDYFIDDVEYESLTEDDGGELDPVDSRSTATKDFHGNQIQISGQTRELKEMLALFPTPDELNESGELDLDWALIKLVDQQDWRPNAFVFPNVSSRPVFLSKVAESQPTRAALVFIITGKATPQRGILLPGTSILGGINGRTPSAVWTVALCEPNSEFATSPSLGPCLS